MNPFEIEFFAGMNQILDDDFKERKKCLNVLQ